jgi:hypothetical protein
LHPKLVKGASKIRAEKAGVPRRIVKEYQSAGRQGALLAFNPLYAWVQEGAQRKDDVEGMGAF